MLLDRGTFKYTSYKATKKYTSNMEYSVFFLTNVASLAKNFNRCFELAFFPIAVGRANQTQGGKKPI